MLMHKILHHLGNPINNGIIILGWLAGFWDPSTVVYLYIYRFTPSNPPPLQFLGIRNNLGHVQCELPGGEDHLRPRPKVKLWTRENSMDPKTRNLLASKM